MKIKLKLNKEVIDFLEATQSIFIDDNDEKQILSLGVYSKIDQDGGYEIHDLKKLPLQVKHKILKMIGLEHITYEQIKNETNKK